MRKILLGVVGLVVLAAAAFYGLMLYSRGPAPLPEAARVGAQPTLPPPHPQILPTINTAHAVGWPDKAAAPKAAPGLSVTRFADGLDHPRWLYRLPNGDVLVAEATTKPSKGNDLTSLVGNRMQRAAGAFGTGPDRIVLLRDANGDGVAEQRSVFLDRQNQPFGMALIGTTLYVANTDALWAYPYTAGETQMAAKGRLILKLPHRDGDNGHWTRNLLVSPDGSNIFISVGSSSNLADHGMAAEKRRADILQINPDGSGERIYASGLRNPNGMAWEPQTGALWTVVNERDMLGDDLAPDYLTHVVDGGFYGWPYSYWGKHPDPRVTQDRPDLVARAIVPDYSLGSHVAPLGLVFDTADGLPNQYRGGAFVALHGSWNRSKAVGYKVVFVPFANGKPAGPPRDVLTGFLDAGGQAQGRPVGLIFDRSGALLVADDVGGVVWRLTAKPSP